MVSVRRPMIHFLDDPLEAPDDLVVPQHDPLRSAFVPYATGLLMNEMKSYMEWMSSRGEYSWMNEDWEFIEDLYSYWPYLEDDYGAVIDPYYYAYTPSIVYALAMVADDSFKVVGVVVLSSPPGLELAEDLENLYPSKEITRLNMTLVPLEMIDVPEETIDSVVYYWVDALSTLDWSAPRYRLDTLVFWSNMFRERMNDLIQHGDIVEDPNEDSHKSDIRYYPDQKDILRIKGLYFDYPTYNDPLTSSSFVEEIRSHVPELPPDVSAQEISLFFRTGGYIPSVGNDPGVYHKLNAILCKYPEEVQDRLYMGVGTSLDPRNVDEIGAGFTNGRQPNREGKRLLTYEDLLQPRP